MDRARTTPDDDVVSAFVNGDESALKHLYDAHSRLVHSYCRRVVGADLAADVTQEVFIAAWKSRERFRPDQGTLTGWLMGIAGSRPSTRPEPGPDGRSSSTSTLPRSPTTPPMPMTWRCACC